MKGPCRLDHDRVRATVETWKRCTAPLAGYSDSRPAIQATNRADYECRNCIGCGSTLMRRVRAAVV